MWTAIAFGIPLFVLQLYCAWRRHSARRNELSDQKTKEEIAPRDYDLVYESPVVFNLHTKDTSVDFHKTTPTLPAGELQCRYTPRLVFF